MRTILLVENDKFIRDIASTKLIESGYQVQVAESGELALQHIREDSPDLMILDLELDGMQGLDVLQKLSDEPPQKPLPIIVFSNNDDVEIKEKCREYGVQDFFLKINTDMSDLIKKINKKVS